MDFSTKTDFSKVKNVIEKFIYNLSKKLNINKLSNNKDLITAINQTTEYHNLNINKITTSSYSIKYNDITNLTATNYLADVTIDLNFNYSNTNLLSSCSSQYLFLLQESNKNLYIANIYNKESLSHILNSKPNIDLLNNCNLHLKSNINHMNSILCTTKAIPSVYRCESERQSKYDKEKAALYARQYALNYNKDFLSFNDDGGDCTNFSSQALNFGGVPLTKTWKPYSNPWVRVRELRDYLINNNLATEKYVVDSDCLGCLIQFYNDERKDWTHSGIISYVSSTTCLYCCHSYDKLNYPLEFTYPILYPKIRVICPH
ncbi:MAG: amidase domain-containing protein [Clostridium sp.]|uniref:amidase domain-containing protein n=1 Tax=Clostridium sp. TaxID=1506 RepID=UPI003F3B78DE